MNANQNWTVPKVVRRAFLFVVLAVTVFGLGQLVEVWLLPTASAEMAVRQLESSNAAAESLRLYEWLRSSLPAACTAVIAMIGLVLFVPGLETRVLRFFQRQF